MWGRSRSANAYHQPDSPYFTRKTHQEHLNLTLGVELEMTISLEPTLYKFSELLRESRIIQVVHSETGPGGFGRVSWSDTLLGGTDG
jgi:hypothetical protein